MDRMFAKRTSQVLTGTGTDDVLVGWHVPSDTVIHDIRITVQMVGQTEQQDKNKAVAYGMELWLLPMLDPDRSAGYNAIWDELVPKDTDTETIDTDTGATDTSPMWEPGEHSPEALFDIGMRHERLYGRYPFLTQNSRHSKVFLDNETPFGLVWNANDVVNIHIGRKLRVVQPSLLLLGCGSPSLDDTTATFYTTTNEADLAFIKYASSMWTFARMMQLGLAADQTMPFDDASVALLGHLEPDIYEETAGFFATEQFNCVTRGVLDHSVPGDMSKTSFSSSRGG